MHFYKAMIDAAKHGQGFMTFTIKEGEDYVRAEKDLLSADGFHVNNRLKLVTKKERELFYEVAAKAKIFVIDLGAKAYDGDGVRGIDETSTLDLPFSICSFEPAMRDGMVPLVHLLPEDGQSVGIIPIAMIVNEVSPGVCDIYAYQTITFSSYDNRDKSSKWTGLIYHKAVNGPESVSGTLLHDWLHRMKTGVVGVETIREKRQTGSRSEKRKPIIRQIIRVVPKKDYQSTKPLIAKVIDWSHRWTCRGHWRICSILGKNRAGEYCVPGFTWVTDHIKGPPSAPLFDKKVRVFANKGEGDGAH